MAESTPSGSQDNTKVNDSGEWKIVSDVEKVPSSDVSSFYEINVHENLSSESNASKSSSYAPLRVKVKQIGGDKDDKENSSSIMEGIKMIANPLIESYYPFLQDQGGNITIEVNVSQLDGKECPKKKESVNKSIKKGSAHSENTKLNKTKESSIGTKNDKDDMKMGVKKFTKMRRKLKRQILRDLMANKDNGFKNLPWPDATEHEQLHFHHHEHHHHYYVDSSKIKEGSEYSLHKDGSQSTFNWVNEKGREYKKTAMLEDEDVNAKEEKANCIYESNQQSFTLVVGKNSQPSNLTFVRQSDEDCAQLVDTLKKQKSSTRQQNAPFKSRSPRPKSAKKTTSVDSVLSRKKSALLVFHNYSDTKLSKCESEDGVFADGRSSKGILDSKQSTCKKPAKMENGSSKTLTEGREVEAGHINEVGVARSSETRVQSALSEKWKYEKEKKKIEGRKKTEIEKLSVPSVKQQADFLEEADKCENRKGDVRPDFSSFVSKNPRKTANKMEKETCENNATAESTISKAAVDTGGVDVWRNVWPTKKITKPKSPKSVARNAEKIRSVLKKKVERNEDYLLAENENVLAKSNSKSDNFGQQGKFTDLSHFTGKKSDHYWESRRVSLQFWSQKLRRELKEIKKELRTLEKKHMKDFVHNRLMQMRNLRSDEVLVNGISVYSSRTYIVGGNNFKIMNNNDIPRKREFPTSFQNRNMFTQRRITYLYSSPKAQSWAQGLQQQTEGKFTAKGGFYLNQHVVSRERKV